MGYTAVTVEGGLFPSDLLDRIATGEAEGQRAVDFGLDGSRRLVDEIQSAFSDARSFWDAFQRRLERSRESRTTITREDWVVPFLELLGFYNLQLQRASLEAGGESFFISHVAGDEPGAPPVHIVALDQDLDRRNGARRSPHALVQDYLNRSDALWGIVTNGRHLRLLRDSARLSKPTYLEFDLEGMIASNLYSEFVLLYRLLHASRFPRDGATAHECLLERYYQQGIDEGGRVRDKLRDGVQAALEVLGTAFLAHPDSGALRDKFARGQLDAPRYYRQLLRLVYRLLFLMVAEERRLIFPPDADATRQAVYTKYYSVTRLRDRAERYFAGDENGDLWLGLRQTFRLFRDHDAAQKLGLSALDGELFGPHACEDLEGARCTNEALLSAVRHLSTFVDDGGVRRRRVSGVRRRVNYAGLDVEEFGSVYESLLDYHPQVTLGPPRFDLVAGSERKQTGSYYTPPQLVHELIESALVPVMEKKLRAAKTREEKERALLDLRVCDPAAGSGHFLLAAARRIARELAKVRSGEDEPAPDEYRRALRDVIRQCVYAVDKNPLAVDLCKVALWIEGHNAGLPLSFLDHHVKCGDSLVGVFDLRVLEEGIPDEAYKPVTGDDKAAARYYRDRNRQEKRGQRGFESLIDHPDIPDEIAAELRALAEQDERSPDDVHAKEELYAQMRARGTEWERLKIACDLWTYAFFAPLQMPGRDNVDHVPTTDTVRRALANRGVDAQVRAEANALSTSFPFFHWPLEFPDVFERSGFDVVLGNPPYSADLNEGSNKFLKSALETTKSNANSAIGFMERSLQLLAENGLAGLVVPKSLTFSGGWGQIRVRILPGVVRLVDVGQAFPGVLLEQVLIAYGRRPTSRVHAIYAPSIRRIEDTLDKKLWRELNVWITYFTTFERHLLDRLSSLPRLGSLSETGRGLGLQRLARPSGSVPLYGGAEVGVFELLAPKRFLGNGSPPGIDRVLRPKVMSQNMVAHIKRPRPHVWIKAAIDWSGTAVPLDTVNCTVPLQPDELGLAEIALLLNSKFASWYATKFIFAEAHRTMHLDAEYVGRIPVPQFNLPADPSFGIEGSYRDLIRSVTTPDCYPDRSLVDRIVYLCLGLDEHERAEIESYF